MCLIMFKPTGSFEVKPLPVVAVTPAWGNPWKSDIPEWQIDTARKQTFAEFLNVGLNAFEAACRVFGDDTNKALWASINWLNDPVVIDLRDNGEQARKLLDKDELAFKVLEYCDEKDPSGRFCTVDHKDRIAYLRLYGELRGYIGKVEIDQSTRFINNAMKIVVVRSDNQNSVKTIDVVPTQQHQGHNNALPLNIKVVK